MLTFAEQSFDHPFASSSFGAIDKETWVTDFIFRMEQGPWGARYLFQFTGDAL